MPVATAAIASRYSRRLGAAKCADDLGHNSDCGQKDDVHVGMAENPKQVLPQEWIAARLRIKKMKAKETLQSQKELAAVSEGIAKITANEVTRIAQQNNGIRLMDMPGARILKDGHDEIDCAGGGGNAEKNQPQRPKVEVQSW